MRSSRGSEEGPTGGMLRAPELLRRPEEDDPALLHQPDRVAEQQPLTHVVRHEDDRLAETPLQREELALQLDARDGIERPERLIQQEERRVGGEGPGAAHSPAPPAPPPAGGARARPDRAPPTSGTGPPRVRPAPSGIGDRRSCPATARRAPRPRESGAGSPERTCRSGSCRAARPYRGAALLRPSALPPGGRRGNAWR